MNNVTIFLIIVVFTYIRLISACLISHAIRMQQIRCVHDWEYLNEYWDTSNKQIQQIRVYKICKMCGKRIRTK